MDPEEVSTKKLVSDTQLAVIRSLVFKCPPSEVYILMDEIKELLQDYEIPEDYIESVIRDYNLTNAMLFEVDSATRPLLVNGLESADPYTFADAVSKRKFIVDHLSHTIRQEVEYEDSVTRVENSEIQSKTILDCMDNYVKKRFGSNTGYRMDVLEKHIDVVIVSELVKLSTYYCGRWKGQYHIEMMDEGYQVSGSVDIATHYFENGNMQMKVHKDMEMKTIKESDHSVDALIKQISSFEDDLQEGLQSAFAAMQQDTLKEIRLQCPRTHSHFIWVVNAQKMVDTIKESL